MMTIDRIVMAFAGTMILVSLALSQLFGPWWLSACGLCRTEPPTGRLHAVLSFGDPIEEIWSALRERLSNSHRRSQTPKSY